MPCNHLTQALQKSYLGVVLSFRLNLSIQNGCFSLSLQNTVLDVLLSGLNLTLLRNYTMLKETHLQPSLGSRKKLTQDPGDARLGEGGGKGTAGKEV